MQNQIKIFSSQNWSDYSLMDTGGGEKLEQFGKYTFVRPCEDAIWPKTLSQKEWDNADGKFFSSKDGTKAGWKISKISRVALDIKWIIEYKGIKFFASPTPFRHLGFFPEQASHWDFIEKKIKESFSQKRNSPVLLHPSDGTFRPENFSSVSRPKFLNLFGYTGVASLFALRAGAEITHLDASKQILKWAKENQKLNSPLGLDKLPMRIIEDDAIKFLEREIKRGNKYDAVIIDPPKFGRGPKGEVWKIEEKLSKLLSLVPKVLSDKPLFVILTSYATDSSSLSLGYALSEVMKDFHGKVEQGELCVLENSNNRFIPLANTAVWSA